MKREDFLKACGPASPAEKVGPIEKPSIAMGNTFSGPKGLCLARGDVVAIHRPYPPPAHAKQTPRRDVTSVIEAEGRDSGWLHYRVSRVFDGFDITALDGSGSIAYLPERVRDSSRGLEVLRPNELDDLEAQVDFKVLEASAEIRWREFLGVAE